MSNKKYRSSNGKGYYIALVLCAVAIGVCGYLYYQNANVEDPQLNDPNQTVGATLDGEDLPVISPRPTLPPSGNTEATEPPSAATTAPRGNLRTASPVEGQTVAVYAMNSLSYNQTTRDWRTHDGIDIAADAGTTVSAAADGTVYTVYEDDTMGMTVVIVHEGGYATLYSSLASEVLVAPGDTVTLGQAIGTVGSSALLETALGDHVHFSVSLDGEPMDPVDFLNQD